jgi:hypothetical protein
MGFKGVGEALKISGKQPTTQLLGSTVLVVETAGYVFKAFSGFRHEKQKEPYIAHVEENAPVTGNDLRSFVSGLVEKLMQLSPLVAHFILVFEGKCAAKDASLARKKRVSQNVSLTTIPRATKTANM